jgi:sulfotransferase
MNKTYHFMAGLPRSGSTLLKSILDQNPKIHANPVSPVMELMYHTEEYLKQSEQYLGYPKPKSAYKIIQSYIENYYFDREEPVIIDHCRAWPNNIERIKTYITPNPKIICPVRDIAEILTSFITMVHRNKDQVSFIDQHLIERGVTVDDDNRCQYLMGPEGIVEQALWSLSQAFIKNDTRHLFIVEYENLVNNPDEMMRKIYDFLELDYYNHNFKNVENNHRENDNQWYLKDMHYVRKEVKKISKKPEDVLSSYILNKYKQLEYWKYPESPYLINDNN